MKKGFSYIKKSEILMIIVAITMTITTTITMPMIDNPFTNLKDAYADEIVGQEGVNDNLIADGEDEVWGDSSGSVDSSFVAGDDTITATGSSNTLVGDAVEMLDSIGGNDLLTSKGDKNYLYGDASINIINSDGDTSFSMVNSYGGTDTLTATGSVNNLFGEADEMYSSTGGADTLIATGDENSLIGDGRYMEASEGGADSNNC